ncbi:NAD(P)-dependent oxidoreductase [Halorussus amylolyticus]|uniref:NAD(P)-dependent oxidoreductase n=1 Tax=Halorussus amylolyticus TaxID=1126242 RepID=UPI00104BE587|nr:NAD(P)H-binding protein [Halorussus amylolyticus]
MNLTVFGASGRTGRPLVEQTLERGHRVTAFVRDPAKLGVEHERLTVVAGDAYTGEGVAEAVEDADAVASVLGQTSSGPDDLLTVAGANVMNAMEAHDVRRFVTLVGAGVRTEGEDVSLGGRVVGTLLKLLSREVLEDAKSHVADVRTRDLDWTVVRAPRLTQGDRTGEYRTGDIKLGVESVARGDVADFVLECAESELYVRELPKIGS